MQDKRNMDNMVYNVYQARYMLFAMGLCALYCGLVYNDYFSLGLDFGSRYVFPESDGGKGRRGGRGGSASGGRSEDRERCQGRPCWGIWRPGGRLFGCDPVWHVAGNELLFFNSMKMKMAVILGLIQMTLGILMKGFNSLYTGGFGVDFWCEFMPMIIFDVP